MEELTTGIPAGTPAALGLPYVQDAVKAARRSRSAQSSDTMDVEVVYHGTECLSNPPIPLRTAVITVESWYSFGVLCVGVTIPTQRIAQGIPGNRGRVPVLYFGRRSSSSFERSSRALFR